MITTFRQKFIINVQADQRKEVTNKVNVLISLSQDIDILFNSIELGYSDVIEIFIQNGGDVNLDKEGFTLLFNSVIEKQMDIFKLLINSGANFESHPNGKGSPLWCAAVTGQKEIAIILAEKGADINSTASYHSDLDLLSVIEVAKAEGYIELANELQLIGLSNLN